VPVWKAVPGRFAAQGGLGEFCSPALFRLKSKCFCKFCARACRVIFPICSSLPAKHFLPLHGFILTTSKWGKFDKTVIYVHTLPTNLTISWYQLTTLQHLNVQGNPSQNWSACWRLKPGSHLLPIKQGNLQTCCLSNRAIGNIRAYHRWVNI